jgi:hypothetical protein
LIRRDHWIVLFFAAEALQTFHSDEADCPPTLEGNVTQKSLLFITGHWSGFVLCFALRNAASHCSRVQSLARCSAKTVSVTLKLPCVWICRERPAKTRTLSPRPTTDRPSPCPRALSKLKVAAELREVDDQMMISSDTSGERKNDASFTLYRTDRTKN